MARVAEVALTDSRVRERLAESRHRVLAVDYREDKDDEGRVVRRAEVAIYNYDRDALIGVLIDPRTGAVTDIAEREGVTPPITDEERAEAIQLASSGRVAAAAFRRRDAEIVAFPTPSYAFDSERSRRGHRGCTLYVRTGRGNEVAITVDLSAREVVPNDRLPEVLQSPGSAGAVARSKG
jgi:Cu2+-containing amine oxidase